MYNYILAIPADTELTKEQEKIINGLKAQWVRMAGTREYNGKYLVDVLLKKPLPFKELPQVVTTQVEEEVIVTPAVTETLYTKLSDEVTEDRDGVAVITSPAKYTETEVEVTPAVTETQLVDKYDSSWDILYDGSSIHPDFINYLPDVVEYDAEGNEISRERPVEIYEPHRFAGLKRRF